MVHTLLEQQQQQQGGGLGCQLAVGGSSLAHDVGVLRASCPTLLVVTPGRLMDLVTQVWPSPVLVHLM